MIVTPDTLFNCVQIKDYLHGYVVIYLHHYLKHKIMIINITFKELYEKTRIHLNIFAVEYNTTTLVNFNKDTYQILVL